MSHMTASSVRAPRGFSLVEMLVTLAVIGLLATFVMAAVTDAYKKGRDAARKQAVSSVGRFLAGAGCYVPDAGPGDYDLGDVFGEFIAKNPQAAQFVSSPPKDPKGGTDQVTKYRYVVSADGQSCSLYADLENAGEPVTLPGLSVPTPGGGTGVLKGSAVGVNGTDRYFEVSNK